MSTGTSASYKRDNAFYALDKVERILLDGYSLCDACTGRLFGLRGYGLSNTERGRALKTLLIMKAFQASPRQADLELLRVLARTGFEPARELLKKLSGEDVKVKACSICEGLTGRYYEFALRAVEEAKSYEFNTFEVGVRIDAEVIRREEELWRRYGLESAESIRNEASREVGKIISKLTGKEYSRNNSELLIIVDLSAGAIELHPAPVFVYGRYRKYARGLPQNPWPQPDERIKFNTSIEELIVKPALELFEAEKAKFHAAGREDIDVRTLGTGRPFVLEIKKPRKRNIDLKVLAEKINSGAGGLIEVLDLAYTDRKTIKKLKSLASIAKKAYVARVKFEKPVDDEKLAEISKVFSNAVINQRTPTRVLHRRVDKLRKKIVYRLEARKISQDEVEFYLETQGGFYVKEFIHGDNGRTTPSIAEFLGNNVLSIELDVVSIEETAA